MIQFTKDKLDEWLADYEAFNRDFRYFCFAHFRVHSVHSEFIPNVIAQIHAQWVSDNKKWLEEETDEKTTVLSHVKICALLLYNLNSEPFLGNFRPYVANAPTTEGRGNGEK